MLEKAVILERNAANPPKHGAFHEVVGVGAKLQGRCQLRIASGREGTYSINNVVVVPDVNLWNRRICRRKCPSTEPANVVLEVVLVTFCSKIFSEWIFASLVRICNCCPTFQWTIDLRNRFSRPPVTYDLDRVCLREPRHCRFGHLHRSCNGRVVSHAALRRCSTALDLVQASGLWFFSIRE